MRGSYPHLTRRSRLARVRSPTGALRSPLLRGEEGMCGMLGSEHGLLQ
jgi:hypothetical protein